MGEKLRVGIVGASGYTGAELLRLCARHRGVELVEAYAARHAGLRVADVFPHLARAYPSLVLDAVSETTRFDCDAYFLALPHGTSHAMARRIVESGARVVDLSADFRLVDLSVYQRTYGVRHEAPELLSEAVYGLVELYRERIATARLVANPGCLARASLLALIPLARSGVLVQDTTPIVDAKTGVSGAGRHARDDLMFSETNEDVRPYTPFIHRHVSEIEQIVTEVYGAPLKVSFVPHLVSIDRGILASAYVQLARTMSPDELRELFSTFYAASPFVHVLEPGLLPSVKRVRGSNVVEIAVVAGQDGKQAAVFVALDNLVGGASGNAVHCLNVMFGFAEDEGLRDAALWP